MQEARELAHILETNPILEIKSRRMSPFSELALLRYAALGQKKIPLLIAAKHGRSFQVKTLLSETGANVYFAAPEIDYFRCAVDIDKVMRIFNSDDVLDAHLGLISNIGNEFDGDGFPAPRQRSPTTSKSREGDTRSTRNEEIRPPQPLQARGTIENLSHHRSGLDEFRRRFPTYDGRGVTIGQIDTGAVYDSELLTSAKTVSGLAIPKLAKLFDVHDASFEANWENVTSTYNPSSLVQMSPPIASRIGTIAFDGRTFETPGPGVYRIGIWRYGRSATPLLLSEHTGEVRLDINNDGSFADDKSFGDFGSTHTGFDYEVGRNTSISGVFQIAADRSVAVILRTGHAAMSGVAAAGNSLRNTGPIGAAPGARLSFAPMGASLYQYIEAALAMAQDKDVDIINYSVTPVMFQVEPSIVATLLNRIVRRYRKPIFASVGNSRGNLTSVDTIAAAETAIAVGGFADATLRSPEIADAVTSAGPSLLGSPKPNLLVPSPIVTGFSSLDLCDHTHESGTLAGGPSCLGEYSFTSFYSPYAAGVAATLLSAAKQEHIPTDGLQLRYALEVSARFLRSSRPDQQGNGAIDVINAWNVLRNRAARSHEHYAIARVASVGSQGLTVGRGIIDLNGPAPGESRERVLCFRFIESSSETVSRAITSLIGNDGTFRIGQDLTPVSEHVACLGLVIAPSTEGVHSALVRVTGDGVRLAEAQATVISPTRLRASDSPLTRTGKTGPQKSTELWLEVPPSLVAIIDLEVEKDGGSIECIPSGNTHPVYNTYYAPRLFPRYKEQATVVGSSRSRTVLDIPKASIWGCNVRTPDSSPANYQITVHSAPIMPDDGESQEIRIDLNSGVTMITEPVAHYVELPQSDPSGLIVHPFTVPLSAASLFVDSGTDRGAASIPAWTLFHCPAGKCRAWYSTAIDRSTHGGLVVTNPEAGEWMLVAVATGAATDRRASPRVAITTRTGVRTVTLGSQLTHIGHSKLPSQCQTTGCLVRVLDATLQAPKLSQTGTRQDDAPLTLTAFLVGP